MKRNRKSPAGNRLVPLAFVGAGERAEIAEVRGLRHRSELGQCLDDSPASHHGHHMHKPYLRGHRGHSDRGHRWVHRLNCLGLVPGEEITVIKNDVSAPLILAVKDSRICLGRGIASKLMVRPLGEEVAPPRRAPEGTAEDEKGEER